MQPPAYIVFFKNFFSRKDVSLICLILAIVIKILFTYYFQQFDNDKLFQAMIGKSLTEGHGLTLKQVHVSNLSQDSYEAYIGWPPGYSVLFAIIYSLVRDLEVSCFIIDVICVILYIIFLQKLLRQLEFPGYLINLLLLFNGFAITTTTLNSYATDFLSLTLIVCSCYLFVQFFRQKRPGQGILLGVVNLIIPWIRYMYIPMAFVIPAVLIWNGWFKKDRKFLVYGICTMVLALLSIIALLNFQELYVVTTEKGFFWSNLLYISPVLFSAFMDLEFFLMQLSHLTGLSYSTCKNLLHWINIVPFLFLLAWLCYYSLKRKWLAISAWQLFMIIGSLIAICIFGVLALLSLTHSMYFPPPDNDIVWTYVSEDRYYVFLHLFIVIIVARWLFMDPYPVSRLIKWAQGLFLFLFSITIGHGVYFLVKNFTFDRRNFAHEAIQHRMIQFIANEIKENKDTDVVVAGNNFIMIYYGVLLGGKGLYVRSELNEKEIHADKPTKIIAVAKSAQLPFYSPFLKREGVKLETQIGGFNFYSFYVQPNTGLQN